MVKNTNLNWRKCNMALFVGGTAVTGTQTLDATVLSGNLPALDGSNLTNLPASSSIPVVSVNTVGSYSALRPDAGVTSISYGSTRAASNCRISDSNNSNGGSGGISGTWKQHGYAGGVYTSTWQRIS